MQGEGEGVVEATGEQMTIAGIAALTGRRTGRTAPSPFRSIGS